MFKSFIPCRGVAAVALGAIAAVALAGCETDNYGQGRYAPYEAGAPARVQEATVVSFRPIQFGGGADNNEGTAVGAVSGGVLGSVIGGDRHGGSLAGGLIGAAVGAVAGHEIAKGANDRQGFLYTVRMRRDGGLLQVAQPDRYPIPNGSPVFVSFGARVRIEPATGYAPPPPPPPPPSNY